MSSMIARAAAAVLLALGAQDLPKGWNAESFLPNPRLERAPRIDGDLSEWKDFAFTDGVWDLARLRQAPWYDPAVNRLTIHPGETGRPEEDLNARYYMAWDDEYLYLGAEVHDNVNDTIDPSRNQNAGISRIPCAGLSRRRGARDPGRSAAGTTPSAL